MSTLDLDFDDPIAARLRLALEEIADRGLGDDRAPASLRPGIASPRRQWVRPATIAAALLLVLGVVAVVAAVTADDENGTPVYVDGPQEPLRFVPTVLPDGMTARNVQHFGLAGRADDADPREPTWIRTNAAGAIDAIVDVSVHPAGYVPPEQSTGPAGFVMEDPECGTIVLTVRGDVQREAVNEMMLDIRCVMTDGAPVLDVPPLDGFERVESPVRGEGLLVELVGSGRYAALEILSPERAMDLSVLVADPLGIDPRQQPDLTIDDAIATPIERSANRAYVWEPRPGVLAVVSSIDLSFEELAEIVRGVREVDEGEWNAWLATLPDGGGVSEAEAPSDDGASASTTPPSTAPATSVPRELEQFIESGEVPWFPPVQLGSPLGVVTSQVGDASCVALLTEEGRIDGGCGPPGTSYANYDIPTVGTVWFGQTVAANASIDDVFGPGTTGWVGPIGPDSLRPYLATYVPPNEVPREGSSTSSPPALQRLVEAGEQLWVAPTAHAVPLGIVTRPNGDATCVALLAGDERYESGCGSPGGASYSDHEVPGVGTVWFGLAIPQAPTLAEAFGLDITQWSGPALVDGRRPVLGVRASTG